MTIPTGKLFAICGTYVFKIDRISFLEEAALDSSIYSSVIVGDSENIWIASNPNIIKKIDPTGNMSILGSYTLINGSSIRAIEQDGSYLYVLCLDDSDFVLSPRIIRVTKSDWTETSLTLPAIDELDPSSLNDLIIDGTSAYIAGTVNEELNGAIWIVDLSTFTISSSKKYTNKGSYYYQDFKYWIIEGGIEDPNNNISIPTHNYLDFIAKTNENAYFFFETFHRTEFTDRIKIRVSTADDNSIGFVWMCTGAGEHSASALHNDLISFIGLRIGKTSGQLFFQLHEDNGGVSYLSDPFNCSIGTNYYIKLVKSDAPSLGAYFYSDPEYSQYLGSIVLGLHDDYDDEGWLELTYFYSCSTWNLSEDHSMTISSEDYLIDYSGDWTNKPLSGPREGIAFDSSYIYIIGWGLIFKITKSDLLVAQTKDIIPSTSHVAMKRAYHRTTSNDLFVVFNCDMAHIMKIRTENIGMERHLSIPDWNSVKILSCAGIGDFLFVGAQEACDIKKIELIGDLSVEASLTLSQGWSVNGMWVT